MRYTGVLLVSAFGAIVGALCFGVGERIADMDKSEHGNASYPAALHAFCDQVTAGIVAGDYEESLGLVASRSIIPDDRFRAVKEKSLELLSLCVDNYGPASGSELFLVEAVGTSIYRLSYLIRFEKFAVRLSLTFYGQGDAYVVTDYHLSQDFEGFFRRVDVR